MPHQKRAFTFLKRRPRAGLFMRPGTGKTLVSIRAAKPPALVICRSDDFLTWETELTLEGFLPLDMDFIGSAKDVADLDPHAIPNWTIVTYDLCKSPDVFNYLLECDFKEVIADECQLIKRPSSARHKDVVNVTRHIPRRRGLTGSPITNDVIDVFGQFRFIDDGHTFGTNEWRFRKRYYIQAKVGKGQGGKVANGWFPKRGAKDKIADAMKESAFHVHEDDVLDLPPVRSIALTVPMSGAQRRYTEQVLKHWEMEIDEDRIDELDWVIQQVSKLRQIASGFFYYYPDPENTKRRKARLIRCPKLDRLVQMFEDGELEDKRKVVVWAVHGAEIRRICRTLDNQGITNVPYMGSFSPAQRRAARLEFKPTKKGPRVFVAQADMGVGMNELICADTAVWFSNSYRVASRMQSEARTRRKGSEIHDQITHYDLLTAGSIDAKVLQSIRSNMSVADYILARVKLGNPLRKILASRSA